MNRREAVGQLICPTLAGGSLQRHAYDPAVIQADLAQHQWGGYILFHAPADIGQHLSALQAQSPIPLLLAADMERGAGQQVAGLHVFPTAMAFGAAHDPAYAEALGEWTAREALAAGINWILAPVADVTNNPLNPIISIRSFGGDSAPVGTMVAAFVRGCQRQGALACAKHFPGHGDTATDSHSRLGVVTASRSRLDAVELPPFRAAITAGVASIMTAHLAVPALGAPDRPATVSPSIITGLLRDELEFEGLIVTDALLMGGITTVADPCEAAIDAIVAGCDMLLMPPDPAATFRAVLAAVESGRISEARLYDAAGRILTAKHRLHAPPAVLPAVGVKSLDEAVASRAITLARGEVPESDPDNLLAIAVDDGADPQTLQAWASALQGAGIARSLVVDATTPETGWESVRAQARGAKGVLLGFFSPIRVSKDRSLLPPALLAPLQRLTQLAPTTVASFSSPFLVAQFPDAAAWVLAYGAAPSLMRATIRAVLGHAPFAGQLPVDLPESLAVDVSGNETHRRDGPAFA